MSAVQSTPSGPPAGVWGSSRLARRVSTHLLRLLPLRLYGRIFPRRAIGLCYHVVSDRSLSHVRNLYRYKDRRQFAADLAYLKRNFHVASYEELEAGTDPNAVVITFDDGLSECFDVVRPLLLEHALPCIFFVSPPHLDNAAMFAFDKASLVLDAMQRTSGPEHAAALADAAAITGGTFPDLAAFARWLTSWIRTLTVEQEPVLDALCDRMGVDEAAFLAKQPYLTREQVRTLAADGFTIGGHGLRHTALGAFPNAVVEQEIEQSCAEAAALSGRARVPFAFPFDGNGVDRDALARLRERNPQVGLLFNTGPIAPDADFMVNRMIVDEPALVGATRSNLAGHFRGMYLEEVLRAARGDATSGAAGGRGAQ